MANEAFSLDFADFNKKFIEYALKTAPAVAEDGMFKMMTALKIDADEVTPKTPHLEGNLRGDYTIILEGITQSKVANHSGGKGSDHKSSGESAAERFGASNIIAKLVFRQPYAAKWHEAVNRKVNWSEPGVGPKFLESKMMMFGAKYIKKIADMIKATTEK
jgi:hypothetical protein